MAGRTLDVLPANRIRWIPNLVAVYTLTPPPGALRSIAVSPELCVAAAEFDLAAVKNS
jgi:hypothetical protein